MLNSEPQQIDVYKMGMPVQEPAQVQETANWFIVLMKENWWWIGPIVVAVALAILDVVFGALPVSWQSKLKPVFDKIRNRLNPPPSK